MEGGGSAGVLDTTTYARGRVRVAFWPTVRRASARTLFGSSHSRLIQDRDDHVMKARGSGIGRVLDVLGRVMASTWFIGFGVAVVTWPVTSLAPQTGIDPGWQSGMYLAAHNGLQFGPQVLFTYGPLGFLDIPVLYYTWPARISWAYIAIQHTALCLTLVWVLRRAFSALAAAAIVFITVPLLSLQDPATIIAFVWAVTSLREDGHPIVASALPWVGGAVGALELLIKLNTGVTVLAVCALAVLARRGGRLRGAVALAVSTLAGLALLWLAAGQSFIHLPEFAANSISVASGYSVAMGYAPPNSAWQLWAAFVATVVVFAAVRLATSRGSTRQGALYVLWAAFAFLLFKAGFARQDPDHVRLFFAGALGACFAFAWRPAQRGPILLSATIMVVTIYATTQADPADTVRPGARIRAVIDQARALTNSHRRDVLVANARAAFAQASGLDARSVSALRGSAVAVVPVDTQIAWTFQLHWRPIPVFQAYAAYTRRLDRLNARALSSARAPERILRNTRTIDERLGTIDPPAASLAMLCRYVQLSASPTWQVLRAVSPRCGPTGRVRSVRAAWGEAVNVPKPTAANNLVFVRIHGTEPNGLERIRTLLYRSRERHLVIDGMRPFRLIPGTAADGGVLTVPRAGDYDAPYQMSSDARTLAITKDGGGRSQHRDLRLDFYETTLRGAGVAH